MKAHSLLTAAICAAIWFPLVGIRAQVLPGPASAAAPSGPLLNPDQLPDPVGRTQRLPSTATSS